MGNIVTTIKRFLSNKNTVTILGVLLGIVVLYVGYNYRVDQAIDTVMVPYARETITATSEITQEMIGTMEVLRNFVSSNANLVTTQAQLVNSTDPICVAYGTSVPQGALFYNEQIIECNRLSRTVTQDIPDGYTIFTMSVDIHTTYGNSMYPGDYIDLYIKMTSRDNRIIFGKLIESIEIADVRDNQGNSVFLTSEAKTPAELLFTVPEDLHWLLNIANDINGLELIPVPRNASYTNNPGETAVSSEYLRDEIEYYAQQIPDANTSTGGSTTTGGSTNNNGGTTTE